MLRLLFITLFSTGLFAGESSLVKKALDEEAAFRRATRLEIENILQKLRLSDVDRDLLKSQVVEQIDLDLELMGLLMQQMPSLRDATWSCKTNQLSQIISHTKQFFAQHGSLLLAGELPVSMQGYWDKPRWMDSTNVKELALKASLVLALSKLNQAIDLEESAVMHSTPLPANLHLNLTRLSFFYNQTNRPVEGELAFVHGGYAFGGQRQDQRYFKFGLFGKQFGPQDCSSWISKLMGARQAFSTVDFADYKDFEVKRLLRPVSVKSARDIKSGMIWVTRNNGAGHVNLVLEVDVQNGRVLVIEYARNLPDYEGFGFRKVLLYGRAPTVRDYWFEAI